MTATINSIKDKLAEFIGENIVVVIEAGRNKITVHEGKLTDTYPAIFIVELDDDGEESYERVSFSYADVLTDTIKIEFPDKLGVSLLPEDEKE